MNNFVSAKQISLLYRKFQKYINQELMKYDISSSEYSYFLILYEHEQKLSQDELHRLSGLDRAAVTRSINSLEKKGYVTKKQSVENSRRNVIELTDKALQIKEEVFEVVFNWNKLIHEGIPHDELIITIKSLNKMVGNIEAF